MSRDVACRNGSRVEPAPRDGDLAATRGFGTELASRVGERRDHALRERAEPIAFADSPTLAVSAHRGPDLDAAEAWPQALAPSAGSRFNGLLVFALTCVLAATRREPARTTLRSSCNQFRHI